MGRRDMEGEKDSRVAGFMDGLFGLAFRDFF